MMKQEAGRGLNRRGAGRVSMMGVVVASVLGLSACENAGRNVAVGAAAGAAGSATAAAIRGDDVMENAAVGAATGAAAGLAGSFVAGFF